MPLLGKKFLMESNLELLYECITYIYGFGIKAILRHPLLDCRLFGYLQHYYGLVFYLLNLFLKSIIKHIASNIH
ncbi:hypothetical protein SD74_11030 [Clostridium botulinum]|nr:hypothetical protein SD74_11030 [Clostridium botulinum]